METEEARKPYKKYDPNNKGAQVRDQFGKLEYKRKQIEIGLSQPLLPPITRRGTARYRVLPTKGDPDSKRPIMLEGSYTIFDRFESDPSKARKRVKNITGRKEWIKDKNGNDIEIDEIQMVTFHDGYHTVSMLGNYMEYAFLDLHPRNATNKFRDTSIPAEFERVDLLQNRSDAFRLAEEELEDDAKAEVRAMTDKDDIIAFAVAAGISTMENDKQRAIALIKSDLRGYAQKDPRGFFSLSKNTRQAVKMTLMEAHSFGVIEFMPDEKQWITSVTDEPLLSVLVGNDPMDFFVEWVLDTKGKEYERAQDTYNAIRNMLDRWEVKL